MIKLIIFDFDGVIIQGSNESYFTCYHKALEAVGVHLDPRQERQRILEIWGKGYKFQLEHLLREHKKLLPKAIKVYEQCYYSPLFSQNIRLIKGADIALRDLSKTYQLAIASGMMRKRLEEFLRKFDISGFFAKIVTSDAITNPEDKKPAPHMLNIIAQHLHFGKSQIVYVGDAAADVQMARNAGMIPVVVLTGHLTRQEAGKLNVKYIIPDITHLAKALAELN